MNNSILPSNMTHTHTHIPKIDIYIALPNHHSLRSACTYNERTHTFVFNVPYSFARGSDFVVDNHFRCQFFSRFLLQATELHHDTSCELKKNLWYEKKSVLLAFLHSSFSFTSPRTSRHGNIFRC